MKDTNRLFHNSPKMEYLFGYLTTFVNSDFSHQCQFAFLPPSLIQSVIFNTCNMTLLYSCSQSYAGLQFIIKNNVQYWLTFKKELLWSQKGLGIVLYHCGILLLGSGWIIPLTKAHTNYGSSHYFVHKTLYEKPFAISIQL